MNPKSLQAALPQRSSQGRLLTQVNVIIFWAWINNISNDRSTYQNLTIDQGQLCKEYCFTSAQILSTKFNILEKLIVVGSNES